MLAHGAPLDVVCESYVVAGAVHEAVGNDLFDVVRLGEIVEQARLPVGNLGLEYIEAGKEGLPPLENTDVMEGRVPICLLYTSPSPRDKRQSRMPSSA